jgi:hypothetical protein
MSNFFRRIPRALPWALLLRPFRPTRRRLKGGNMTAQGNALGFGRIEIHVAL